MGAVKPAQLELVVDHELEHLRRGDVTRNALVTFLKGLLGGHPSASCLARDAALAREIAVDARVARRDQRAYASLLVEIAAHAHFGEKPAPVAIDDTALARRIALITEPREPHVLSLTGLWLATAARHFLERQALPVPAK